MVAVVQAVAPSRLPHCLPRRLHRFSLITLLVAVNVAGVLVWANVRSEKNEDEDLSFRGWPIPLPYFIEQNESKLGPDAETSHVHFQIHLPMGIVVSGSTLLLFNIVFSVFIMAFAAALTEVLVRGLRKAKHHDG